MSRYKFFAGAAGTLTLIFALSTAAFADEQITGPPGSIQDNTAVLQITYPQSPVPIEDKQSQSKTLDIEAPNETAAPVDVTASVYTNNILPTEAPATTLEKQDNTLTKADTKARAVQQRDLTDPTPPVNDTVILELQNGSVPNAISQELLPPVTAAENYVDTTVQAAPVPPEIASALPVVDTGITQTNNTTSDISKVTQTSTVQNTPLTNQLASNSTKSEVSSKTVKKELPVIDYLPAKVPPLVTTSIVNHKTKAGDTLYLLAQNFITTIKSIKFLNNLKADYLIIGQFLKVSSNAPQTTDYKTGLDAYKVKAGDTLTSIANKYGTTATSIKTTNALSTNALLIGQTLQVPYVSSVANSSSLSVKYKIAKGDSLPIIAKNFETTQAAIKSLNGLKSNALFAGDYLKIPTSIAAANHILVNTATQKYTIQSGDTLSLIAEKCKSTVAVMKLLNNLTSNALFVGDIIKVPEGSPLAISEGIAINRAALSSRYQATRSEELLLARLIYAESRGESYEGQVAVGAVVLNRTKSPDFPKTIGEVIYQQYEFSAVLDGQINLTPDASSMKAAAEALQGADPSGGALFYWNPIKAPNNKFLNAKPIIKRIGDHVFAK